MAQGTVEPKAPMGFDEVVNPSGQDSVAPPGFDEVVTPVRGEFGDPRVQMGVKPEGFGTLDAMSLAGKMMLSPDPMAQADIILKNVPGSTVDFDENLRPIIDIDGNRTYVNAPGASPRDFIDLAASILKFWPAAKYGAGGSNLLMKMVRTGFASGLTSVGEDVAAGAAGSEQGIDPIRAGISVAAGAGAEAAVPAIGWAMKKLAASRPGQMGAEVARNLRRSLQLGGYIADNGFTKEGLALLRQLGIKAEEMSQRLALSYQRTADEAISPEAARGVAEAESFGVPITRGEALEPGAVGQFEQRAEEEILDQALKDDQSLRPFRNQQQQPALIGQEGDTGLGQLQGEVGGTGGRPALDAAEPTPQGSMAARQEQGGEALQGAVQAEAKSLAGQRDKAFAEAAKGRLRLASDAALDGVRRIRGTLRNREDGMFLDQQFTPGAWKADTRLKKMETMFRAMTKKGVTIKPLQLRRIERERSALVRAIDQASTATNKQKFPNDAPLLIGMKRELDRWLDDAVKGSLFDGDAAALQALKKARSLHAQYMTKYGGGKGAANIIADLAQGNATPMEVTNMLFGASTLGAKKTSVEAVERLIEIFGEESAEVGLLREMAFLTIAKQSVRSGRFSPDAFVSAYDKVFTGSGRDVAKAIFTDEGLMRMAEFRSLAGRLQKPAGMRASSGTAERTGRMMESFMRKVMPMLGMSSGEPVTAITFAAAVKAAETRAASKALNWDDVLRQPTTRQEPALPKAAGIVVGPEAAGQALDQDSQ